MAPLDGWGATETGQDASSPVADARIGEPSSDTAGDPALVPAYCPADGWCWENPRPQGNPLKALAGSGPDDVWAVGDVGTILHWDGQQWSHVPGGGETYLAAVWSAGPAAAWAGGSDAYRPSPGLLSWNGQTWAAVETPYPNLWAMALTGSGPDTLWAAGPGGVLYQLKNGSWSAFDYSSRLLSILGLWADGADRLWAVGGNGRASAGNPAALTPIGGIPEAELRAIHGTPEGDVFAVGLGGSIGRGDRRGGWSVEPSPTSAPLNAVWVEGTTAWAVGEAGAILRRSGTGWANVPSPTNRALRAVRAGSTSGWAAGDGGTLVRWDGQGWSTPHDVISEDLNAVWASSDDDVWVVGRRGGIARKRAGRWTRVESGFTSELTSVWGSGPDDVWVGGFAGLLHWDGQQLKPVTPELQGVRGIGGTGPDDVWAVGAAIHHWDGRQWTMVAARKGSSVWAVAADDVWVGQDTEGQVSRFHAGVWSSYPIPACGRVWATAADEVWCIAGDGGSARSSRWNGSAWIPIPCAQGGMYALAGHADDDVWMAGTHGEITHFDGQICTRRGMQTAGPGSQRGFVDGTFRGLWATPGGGIWLVGRSGAILHRSAR